MHEHTHHLTIRSQGGKLLSISQTVGSDDDLGPGVLEEILASLSSLVTDVLREGNFTIEHSAKFSPAPSSN